MGNDDQDGKRINMLLPDELHWLVKSKAALRRMKIPEFVKECLEKCTRDLKGIQRGYDEHDEGEQESIRRSPEADVGKASPENVRDKSRKGSGRKP
jgi:hypothetical protein